MIKITRVQTRPSILIKYFTPLTEKGIYTSLNFLNTSKLTIEHTNSQDDLTRTSVWTWQDQESLDTYLNNNLVLLNRNAEIAYHNAVGITFTETIENI
jgi:hypothetical protein